MIHAHNNLGKIFDKIHISQLSWILMEWLVACYLARLMSMECGDVPEKSLEAFRVVCISIQMCSIPTYSFYQH